MSELTTARLKLRHWQPSDLAPFAALNDDPAVMQFLPARLSRDASDAIAGACQAQLAEHGYGLWAVEVRGGQPFIGYVGLNAPSFEAPFTPCMEVLWRLAHGSWGHGYATEAARACLGYAFTVLGVPEVISFTVPGNVRSRGVMLRLGMTQDREGDFEHPRLPQGHALRRHVLYRLRREQWGALP